MAACSFSNFGGGGGGVVFATTARLTTGSGGLADAGRATPTRDCLVGGTGGGAATTRALAISLSLTFIMLLCTARPLGKVRVEVAGTAPGAVWFPDLKVRTFPCLFTT